jgi:UrcA family protein
MYIRIAARSALSVFGAAVACTLFAGNVAAKDNNVIVTIRVSTEGLDLSRPAAAHELYNRLKNAAREVCAHGDRVDLEASPSPIACYEKALGDAIRSANVPMLTRNYLETHTLQQAAASGIAVPELAAK